MRIRITCLDFGRINPELGCKRYVIECKPHWWGGWKIRDWESKNIPTFYFSEEEARRHL